MLSVTVSLDCNPAWAFSLWQDFNGSSILFLSLGRCFPACDSELEMALGQEQAGGLPRVGHR